MRITKRKGSESLGPMIIIFKVFLDLAPRVEVIFNIGPKAFRRTKQVAFDK